MKVLAGICLLAVVVRGMKANAINAPQEFSPERILIQPKTGAAVETMVRFHSSHNVKVLRTFPRLGGLQVLAVPAGETVTNLVASYQRSGLVAFAEPDYIGHIAATPNDPKYLDGTLWGLNRIDAPGGWNFVTNATNVVVAVLDTGVWYTHQDLAGNMWISPVDGSHGLNALTGTNDPMDDSGHGTGVAGVLGAVGNNSIGVVGVAWRVQIMACKCFNSFGSGTLSDCITCLDYARTNHANLVNASWGFGADSQAFSNAVYALGSAGIILVAAAGPGAGASAHNIDVTPSYPASYHFDNIVTAAFTMRDDTLSTNSNYGPVSVHLAAPGDQIYSTFAGNNSSYFSQSGTSFAAPYVTGTLALLLTRYPTNSYQDIIHRLLLATDPLPSLAGKCASGGRLNVHKALSTPIRLLPANLGAGGLVQLQVVCDANRTCVIQTSPNASAWAPVYTNITGADGTFLFSDGSANNFNQRFYRVTATP